MGKKKIQLYCKKCGREIRGITGVNDKDQLCTKCREARDRKSLRADWAVCRKCGRKFRVDPWRDPRWTLWCNTCRMRMQDTLSTEYWLDSWSR